MRDSVAPPDETYEQIGALLLRHLPLDGSFVSNAYVRDQIRKDAVGLFAQYTDEHYWPIRDQLIASGAVQLVLRQQSFAPSVAELPSGLFDGELPVDGDAMTICVSIPGSCFPSE